MAAVNNIIANTSFSMLRGKVHDEILNAIDLMGFSQPTEIQAKSLPHLLLGKDVIGAAKTGSGKTLAFLIPVIELLNNLGFTPRHGTGCIILSPTRELALQTFTVLEKLTKSIPLTSALVVGGSKKQQECKRLASGKSIIVATPGRLLDHLTTTENFNIKNLKVLVMDEADKLLEAGFERHITGIIKMLPQQRQTVLFSATITEKIENLARLAMVGERVYVSVINKDVGSSTVTGLTQGYYICPVQNRITWLFKMLKKTKKQKVMVFFSSCKSVDFHCEFFQVHCQAQVLSIHGRHSQPKRKSTFQTFVEAKVGVLFCTDVAARGLDIPLVDWIIQYDPPSDPKEYIHRVGRTARGTEGTGNAVLLLRPEEEQFLNFLKKERATLDKFTLDEEETEDVQKMLENLVNTNGVFKTMAKKAYIAFLRSYQAHPMRKVFNINTLDFKAAGKAFGFIDPPQVDIGQLTGAKRRR